MYIWVLRMVGGWEGGGGDTLYSTCTFDAGGVILVSTAILSYTASFLCVEHCTFSTTGTVVTPAP